MIKEEDGHGHSWGPEVEDCMDREWTDADRQEAERDVWGQSSTERTDEQTGPAVLGRVQHPREYDSVT